RCGGACASARGAPPRKRRFRRRRSLLQARRGGTRRANRASPRRPRAAPRRASCTAACRARTGCRGSSDRGSRRPGARTPGRASGRASGRRARRTIPTWRARSASPRRSDALRTTRGRCAPRNRAGIRDRPAGNPRTPSAGKLEHISCPACECLRLGPALSPRAIAQQIEVILFAARLLRLLDRDPPDDPVLVDDERSALRVAGLAKEDAVLLRHVALRVEIGEQRRAQPLVALERAQAPAIV